MLTVFATRVWFLLAGVGTQSCLAWMLAPEGRGAYAVCVLFGTLLGVLFTLGTDRAAQVGVMSGRMSLSEGVAASLAIGLVGSALAALLGWSLIGSSLAFFDKADAGAFRLALLLVPLSVVVTTLQLQLAGRRRFGELAVAAVAQSLLALGSLAILVLLLGLGVEGALLAHALTLVGTGALLFAQLRRRCGLTLALPRAGHLRLVLSWGSRYFVARIGHPLDLGVGTILLSFFATREQIGLFATTTALALKVLLFSEGIEASLLPRVSADARGRVELVGQCVRVSGLLTGLALGAGLLAATPAVGLLLSPAFLPVVPLLFALAPGLLVHGASKVLLTYFRGSNRPGLCSLVVWVGLFVNALTLTLLWPHLGLAAAAWAMTAGWLARSVLAFALYAAVSGVRPLEALRPRRQDLELLRSSLRLA